MTCQLSTVALPVIPAIRKLKQEDWKLETGLKLQRHLFQYLKGNIAFLFKLEKRKFVFL